jgi:hypothetical protein
MKTLKVLDYQQGKILVDDKKVDFYDTKSGDLIYDEVEGVTKDRNCIHRRACYKIIAQTPNLNIEGIPFIELEEDVDEKIIPVFEWLLNKSEFNEEQKEFIQYALTQCYKAAQPKKYTEDDLRKAIGLATSLIQGVDVIAFTYPTEVIIKLLQPKIVSVEVVMHLSDKGENGFEYVTYQKDGKTYLKVIKINYA